MIFAITGSTGFLGVHIIHHLLKMGHDVRAIHRSKSTFREFELVETTLQLEQQELLMLSTVCT